MTPAREAAIRSAMHADERLFDFKVCAHVFVLQYNGIVSPFSFLAFFAHWYLHTWCLPASAIGMDGVGAGGILVVVCYLFGFKSFAGQSHSTVV